jgi:two-component system sensor histidine kinase KdpD
MSDVERLRRADAMSDTGTLSVLRSVLRAVMLAALATAGAWVMDGPSSLAGQAMAYLLAVVFSAFRHGRRDSILTAFLGVAALNFLFVPPRYTFSVENSDYGFTLIALLVVSVVVSGLATRLREEAAQARRHERRARELHNLADALAASEGEAVLAACSLEALRGAFGGGVLLLSDAQGKLQAPAPAPVAFDGKAAQWVFEHGCAVGPATGYWPDLPHWYVPLPGEAKSLGVLAVSSIHSATLAEDLEHLQAFARQIGLALQRDQLTRRARDATLEARTEALRNALLASISHDMRTPLAAILGAASTLSSQALSATEQQQLLHSIEDEARRMTATAENVLQLARLSADRVTLRRDWESIGEIVGTVIGRQRRRGEKRIVARIDDNLPLIRIDAVLVEQVLSNLIDNALVHAAGEIEILACACDDRIAVTVADRGPGLGNLDPARLFVRFQPGSGANHGTGLGLAICKAIVDLHGGTISASNREGGGSAFRFTLPRSNDEPMLEGR